MGRPLRIISRGVPIDRLLAKTFHVESLYIHIPGIEAHRAAHGRKCPELPVRTEIECVFLHQLARHLEMHRGVSHVDVHLAVERTVTVVPGPDVISARSHLLRERGAAFERAVYQHSGTARRTGERNLCRGT